MTVNPFQLCFALGVMALALLGKRARLIALAICWVSILPALQAGAARSSIYPPELLLLVLLPIWLLRRTQDDIAGAPSWFRIQIVAVVAWAFISTGLGHVLAGEMDDAAYRAPMAALRVGGVLSVFAVGASTPTDEQEFRKVWKYLRLAVLVFAFAALVDYSRLVPMRLYFQARQDMRIDFNELTALGYMSRNNFATLCVLATGVLMIALKLRIGFRLITIGAICISLLLLLASGSRALFVGVCAMGCVPPLVHRGARTRNFILLVLGAITVLTVMTQVPAIAERFATIRDVRDALATGGRTAGWIAAVEYLVSDPMNIFVGVGYDRWAIVVGPYCGLSNAHNSYLHILAELGIVFGTIYLLILFRLGWQFLLMTRREHKESRNLASVGLGLLTGLGVASLADVVFVPWIVRMNSVYPLMIILGLVYGRLRYLWAMEASMVSYSYPVAYVALEPPISRDVLGVARQA